MKLFDRWRKPNRLMLREPSLIEYMSAVRKWRHVNDATKARELIAKRPSNRAHDQWYRFENIVAEDTTHIYIYDEIGYWGNTADMFVQQLNEVQSGNITLHVNSPGGDVFDGMAMMNALRNHAASVRAEVDGVAASAASFIIQGADYIVMMPGSQLMIHDASGLIYGNAEELRKLADELERCSEAIAGVYADRAGGTVKQWRARMQETTWYSDSEAVNAGLADEVLAAGKRKGKPCSAKNALVLNVDTSAFVLPDIHSIIDDVREEVTAHFDVDPLDIVTAVSYAATHRPEEPIPVHHEPDVPLSARIAQAVKEGLEA